MIIHCHYSYFLHSHRASLLAPLPKLGLIRAGATKKPKPLFHHAEHAQTTAVRDGDDWVVNGQKIF